MFHFQGQSFIRDPVAGGLVAGTLSYETITRFIEFDDLTQQPNENLAVESKLNVG